jgi:hypothetical protein
MAVASWYGQSKNYDFKKSRPKRRWFRKMQVKSFTQLVWASSNKVGFGLAISRNKRRGYFSLYVVANFNPPGNRGKRKNYKLNVKPAA